MASPFESQFDQLKLACSLLPLLSAGQAEEAEGVYRRLAAEAQSDLEVQRKVGQYLLAQQRFSEAAAVHQWLVAQEPLNQENRLCLAIALQGDQKLELAVDACTRAVELAPLSPMANAKLGQLLYLVGKPGESIRYLRQSLSLHPHFRPSLLFLAYAYLDLRNTADAEASALELLQLHPDDVEVLQLLGRLRQQQGRFAEAVDLFDRIIQIDPDSVAAHFSLTYSRKTSEADLGFLDRLDKMMQKGRSEDELALLNYALGKSNDDLGRFEESNKYFERANALAGNVRSRAGSRFTPSAYSANMNRALDFYSQRPFRDQELGPSESERPVFIVGMVRSGTTLVEQILAAHPEVAAGGEQQFWLAELSRMFASRNQAAPTYKEIRNAVTGYEALLENISRSALRVTDKMPTNYQVLGAILQSFPNARVIHVKRHPVDTCVSIFTTPYIQPPEFALDRDHIVYAYREYQRLMERWRTAFPNARLLEIQYEHLVGEPETAARELIEFLGLHWDDRCLSPASTTDVVNTPSQWQVRQPIYRSSVGRWRNYEPWLGPFRSLL